MALAPGTRIRPESPKPPDIQKALENFNKKRKNPPAGYVSEKQGIKDLLKAYNPARYKNPDQPPQPFYTQTSAYALIKLPAAEVSGSLKRYRMKLNSDHNNLPIEVRYEFDKELGWIAHAHVYDLATEQAAKDADGRLQQPLASWYFDPTHGVVRTDARGTGLAPLETLIQTYHLDEMYELFRYAPVELEELMIQMFPDRFEPGSISFYLMNRMIELRRKVYAADSVEKAFSDFQHLQFPGPLNATARKILSVRLERALLNAFSFKKEGLFADDAAYHDEMVNRWISLKEKAEKIGNPQIKEILEKDIVPLFERAIDYRPAWLKPGVELTFYQKLALLHLREDKELSTAILADEAGLGKTLESIGTALEAGAKKTLIVTLATTMHNWKNEILEKTNVSEEEIAVVDSATTRGKIAQLEAAQKNPKIRFVIMSDSSMAIKVAGKKKTGKEFADALKPDEIGLEKTLQSLATPLLPEEKPRFIEVKPSAWKQWRKDLIESGALKSGETAVIDAKDPEEIFQQVETARNNPAVSHILMTDKAMKTYQRQQRKAVVPNFRYMEKIKALNPDFIVVDEAHRMQSGDSDRSQAMAQIKTDARKLLLSATPVKGGRTVSLFPLLKWLDPAGFDEALKNDPELRRNPSRMNYLLRKMMLRRVKRELPALFVPVTHTKFEFDLPDEWARYYEEIASRLASTHDQKGVSALEFINQLRLAAIHPRLVNPKYLPRPAEEYPPLKDSPKIQQLLKMMQEKKKAGEKVVVFSMSREVINALAEMMRAGEPGSDTIVFEEDDDAAQMTAKEKAFRNDLTKYFCLTTYAKGALSLNLEAATTMIQLDWPWDPETCSQARDRIHRITQTKPVEIISVLARGTLDPDLERIVNVKMVRFAETVDAFLPIEELGEDFVRSIISRSKARSKREAFYMDWREMRESYARGEINQANDIRRRLADGLSAFYEEMPDGKVFFVAMLHLLKAIKEKDMLGLAGRGKKRPVVVGDLFSGGGTLAKALMRVEESERRDMLAKAHWKIVELDPAAEMLERSRQDNKLDIPRDGIVCDINQEGLDLDDQELDMLVTNALNLIPNSFPSSGDQKDVTRRIRALGEMARVLKVGGYLVIVSPTKIPAEMQEAIKTLYGVEALTDEVNKLALDERLLNQMTRNDAEQKKKVKAMLANSYLYIGRKAYHWIPSHERLVLESKTRRSLFDLAEKRVAAGKEGAKKPRGIPPSSESENVDWSLSLDDVDGVAVKPIGYAYVKGISDLPEVLTWDQAKVDAKKAEILAAYNEYPKDKPPLPADLAGRVRLTPVALGYLTLLINHEDKPPFDTKPQGTAQIITPGPAQPAKKYKPAEEPELPIKFPVGSWNQQITKDAVLAAYQFYVFKYKRNPTLTDLSRFFFGEYRSALANNLRKLLKVLREMADDPTYGKLAIRMTANRKIRQDQPQTAPPKVMPSGVSDAGPQEAFHRQALSTDKGMQKIFSGIKVTAPPVFTDEEKKVTFAWSFFLRDRRKFPNFVELSLKAGLDAPALARVLKNIHAKKDLAAWKKKIEALKSGATPDVVSAAVDHFGFSFPWLDPVTPSDIPDADWAAIFDALHPISSLAQLSAWMRIGETPLARYLKEVNLKRWLEGNPELATADAQDAMRINTGATPEITAEYKAILESLAALDQQFNQEAGEDKVDFFNFAQDYLLATVDTETPGASPAEITATAQTILGIVQDLAEDTERNFLLDTLYEDMHQRLLQDRGLLRVLRTKDMTLHHLLLELTGELLRESGYEDSYTDIVLKEVPDLSASNEARIRKRMLLPRLKRALAGHARHPGKMAEVLVKTALYKDDLSKIVSLLKSFNDMNFHAPWLFEDPDRTVAYFSGKDGNALLDIPADEIQDFIDALQALGVRKDDDLRKTLIREILPYIKDIKEGPRGEEFPAERIVETFVAAQKISPALRDALSLALRHLVAQGDYSGVPVLLSQMQSSLQAGHEPRLLEFLLGRISAASGFVRPEEISTVVSIVQKGRVFGLKGDDYGAMLTEFRDAQWTNAGFLQTMDEALEYCQTNGIDIKNTSVAASTMRELALLMSYFVLTERLLPLDKMMTLGQEDERLPGYEEAMEKLLPGPLLRTLKANQFNFEYVDLGQDERMPAETGKNIKIPIVYLNIPVLAERVPVEQRLELLEIARFFLRVNVDAYLKAALDAMAQEKVPLALRQILFDEGANFLLRVQKGPPVMATYKTAAKYGLRTSYAHMHSEESKLRQLLAKINVNEDQLELHKMLLPAMQNRIPSTTAQPATMLAYAMLMQQIPESVHVGGYWEKQAFIAKYAITLPFLRELSAMPGIDEDKQQALRRRFLSKLTFALDAFGDTQKKGTHEYYTKYTYVTPNGPGPLAWIRPNARAEDLPSGELSKLGKAGEYRVFLQERLLEAYTGDSLNDAFVTFIIMVASCPAMTIVTSLGPEAGHLTRLAAAVQSFNHSMSILKQTDYKYALKKFNDIALFQKNPELRDHWQVKASRALLQVMAEEDAGNAEKSTLFMSDLARKWLLRVPIVDVLLLYNDPESDNVLKARFFSQFFQKELAIARRNAQVQDKGMAARIKALVVGKNPRDIKVFTESNELLQPYFKAVGWDKAGWELVLSDGFSSPIILDPTRSVVYANKIFYERALKDEGTERIAFMLSILFGNLQISNFTYQSAIMRFLEMQGELKDGDDDEVQVGQVKTLTNSMRRLWRKTYPHEESEIQKMKLMLEEHGFPMTEEYRFLFELLAMAMREQNLSDVEFRTRLDDLLKQGFYQGVNTDAASKKFDKDMERLKAKFSATLQHKLTFELPRRCGFTPVALYGLGEASMVLSSALPRRDIDEATQAVGSLDQAA